MPDDLSGILESPEHTHLADVGGNTEGPLWHPEGYLTFVSLTESRLYRWDETNGVSVVREDTGEGNGCAFDREGHLLMCEGADHRRVTRMGADGTVTAIAEQWEGKRFHKPNDVVSRSDGSVYF
ncbi:MAG: SMP-30/gluconolactonase/LRE family protein, partial [Chloroflexi bacterium]|nr:SMP-30/gluconolactonase/LRE family protein [Chloroflexota bacterium]